MTELEVGFSPEMVAAILAPEWGPGPIPKSQDRRPFMRGTRRIQIYAGFGEVFKVKDHDLRLEITDLRIEPLQDASLLDLAHEGWPVEDHERDQVTMAEATGGDGCIGDEVTEWFADLWDKRYAARGYGWETNPTVRVVTFRRVIQLTEGP